MADVAILDLPPMVRVIVRGDDAAASAIGTAFGVALPREACRAATKGDRSALWLGPDEWLLLAPGGEASAIAALLAASLRGNAASIVEVSDRQVAMSVSGPRATDVLNAFSALDLHFAAFPVGMCTRTRFSKAEIVLWRTARDAFHIEVWRSFAPYVAGCLGEAAREFVED